MNPRRKRSGSRRRKQGIVLLLILVGGGGFWLSRRDAELYVPPPIPLEERTPKVLVIGIDGVRPDVLAEVETPNIDALIVGGSYTARTRTTTPSVSGPSWSSMLTGVWPEKHGVRDNEFVGRRFDEYPDFLTRIEAVDPELATFAAVDWMPLVEREGGGTTLSTEIDERFAVDGYELGWHAADLAVVDRAIEHLSFSDPDAMFVYLGNPDEVSHATNSIGMEYREAIASADGQIGAIVAAVRARPTFREENWLVIVSTDHGRRADGGHGGISPEEMRTFILVSGPGAARGTPPNDTFIVDVAVTALAHLGIDVQPEWDLDGAVVGLP
ncbi:MAG: alkaline phosphatase family protein [Gemmatimonadota bacterium]